MALLHGCLVWRAYRKLLPLPIALTALPPAPPYASSPNKECPSFFACTLHTNPFFRFCEFFHFPSLLFFSFLSFPLCCAMLLGVLSI